MKKSRTWRATEGSQNRPYTELPTSAPDNDLLFFIYKMQFEFLWTIMQACQLFVELHKTMKVRNSCPYLEKRSTWQSY